MGKGRLRHLELYVVTGGAFLDMCIELLYSTHLHFFVSVGGGVGNNNKMMILNPHHMNDFEHGGMLLMFFLFGAAALLSEHTRYFSLPQGALCLIAATAFSAEYLLFYFHSTSHTGLEGYYHLLLVILVGLCVATTISGSLFPTSFLVDVSSGISIALQGLWFYQTAFTLYGPMMPHGCHLDAVASDIKCKSHDSQVQGELLANFQFFSLILLVFLYVLGSYALAASWYEHPELKSFHSYTIGEEHSEHRADQEEVIAL